MVGPQNHHPVNDGGHRQERHGGFASEDVRRFPAGHGAEAGPYRDERPHPGAFVLGDREPVVVSDGGTILGCEDDSGVVSGESSLDRGKGDVNFLHEREDGGGPG